MAIKVTSTKDAVKNNGFKSLVVGGSGVGKTSLFKHSGKTIVITSEGGDLTLNDYDVDSIRVKNSGELKEAYEYVAANTENYDTVGVDSLTDIGDMIVAELKADPYYGDPKNSMPMWMKFTDIITRIAKSFRDLDNINVIILALPESVKSGFDEKIMPLIPAKKAQAKLGSFYDVVMLLRINEDGNREFICQPTEFFEAKDRSDKLDKVEPCTKEEGISPLFAKVLG